MAAAAAAAAIAPAPATATGRAFDDPVFLWKTRRTAPPGCDTPYYVIGYPDTGSLSSSAFLGDTRANPSPGCSPSFLFLDTACGGTGAGRPFCTVSFDATLWLVAGERACVVLAAGDSAVALEIPGTRVGRAGRYAVSVPAAERIRVVFLVWNPIDPVAGARSVLAVTNVEVHPTSGNITSSPLTPFFAGALPVDPAGLDGYAVQPFELPLDCNANRIPDGYEVSQGLAPDGDGDGFPDDCSTGQRRIDWVLLGMGVLILLVTLFRLVRRRRANW